MPFGEILAPHLSTEMIDGALDSFFPQGWRKGDPEADEWMRLSMRDAATFILAAVAVRKDDAATRRDGLPELSNKARVEIGYLKRRGMQPFGLALQGRDGFSIVGAAGTVYFAPAPAHEARPKDHVTIGPPRSRELETRRA